MDKDNKTVQLVLRLLLVVLLAGTSYAGYGIAEKVGPMFDKLDRALALVEKFEQAQGDFGKLLCGPASGSTLNGIENFLQHLR